MKGQNNRDSEELPRLREELAGLDAAGILRQAFLRYGGKLVFASSLGAEDQVILDLLVRHDLPVELVTLDTGRLPGETLDLLARTEARYNRRFTVYFPEREPVESFVRERGINGFRESVEDRKRCCAIRKLEPLARALKGREAWVCGLRRAQAVTRLELEPVEWDALNGLFKFNPLYDWSEEEVWRYIRAYDVPYNELHDRGYPSIGCACCTRAVKRTEDVRSGRWWWESPEHKECGLHARPRG